MIMLLAFGMSLKKNKSKLNGHSGHVFCLDVSKGNILASGSYDCTVKLWSIDTGECIRTINGHDEAVNSVHFNNDGRLLLSTSYDGFGKLWDLETGMCRVSYESVNNIVSFGTFTPNAKFILLLNLNSEINLCNIPNKFEDQTIEIKSPRRVYKGCENTRYSIPLIFFQSRMVTANIFEELIIYDSKVATPILSQKEHTGVIIAMAQNPAEESILVTGGLDGMLCIWQIKFPDGESD